MKKITIYIAMAVLCLNFTAKAQVNKAIDVTLKGIQIGEKVPDITITNLHNYKNASGKPATFAKISDFKGKLLLLDFWATWCSPCVAMIPKMDSLQKAFGDKIQFLSVTYQIEKEVLPFLEKLEKQQGKHYDLSVVTDDKELHKLFPHTTLPHYVWIDDNGVVRAITEAVYVDGKNITSMLNRYEIKAKVKKDMPIIYDNSRPLFAFGIGNDTSILTQSIFSKYKDGIGMGYNKNTYQVGENEYEKITARNSTIRELFQYAYKKEAKEIIFEVSDSAKFFFKSSIPSDYIDWRKRGNAYCYELLMSRSSNLNSSKIMQKDLEMFFSEFEARIEKRKVRCLALVRTPNFSTIPNLRGTSTANFTGFGGKITNCPITVFIARMQFYLQRHPLPLADDTGYKDWVDLDIVANMSSVKELNSALEKYNLKFVEKDAFIDMLVIRNKNQITFTK